MVDESKAKAQNLDDEEQAAATANVTENAIRSKVIKDFHDETDLQRQKRRARPDDAYFRKDTDTFWQLITAAVEEASIIFHDLGGKEASKMRGRSKVTYQVHDRAQLEIPEDEDTIEDMKLIKAPRAAHDDHTLQCNAWSTL